MGTQPAKCPACKEPQLRERFGCDKVARNPVWAGTCEFCIGSGFGARGEACKECEGTGERYRYRCPASMTSDDGRRALEFACAMELGFLPSEGPYGRQVHSGMNCVNLVRMEKAKIERAVADQAMAKQGANRG